MHIGDRGYQFADGVYEVVAVAGGRLVDGPRHLDRLERSLRELRIAMPMARRALEVAARFDPDNHLRIARPSASRWLSG